MAIDRRLGWRTPHKRHAFREVEMETWGQYHLWSGPVERKSVIAAEI